MWFPTAHASALRQSLAAALLLAVIVILPEIHLLTEIPWLGLGLEPAPQQTHNSVMIKAVGNPQLQDNIHEGDQVLAIKSSKLPYIYLNHHTLLDDPDQCPTLQEYQEAMQHNANLYARLVEADTTLTLKMGDDKEISFTPLASRPITDLPANFWIHNLTALVSLLFAAALHASGRKDITIRLLVALSLFFTIGSTAAAVYSSRGLAMAPEWYATLAATNHLFMPLMAFSLLALLLLYPYQLVPVPVAMACLLIPVVLWLNHTVMQWRDLPLHTFYWGVIPAFFVGILPAVRQWWLSKNKPVERAALKWMLLSIYVACGLEVLFYLLPILLGHEPSEPLWAAQLTSLLIYLGLILGVSRYRLFDVERWWLLSWQWTLSGLFIVCIDLLLITTLHLHVFSALSLAIICVAWVYFPLRQWVWEHLGQTSQPPLEQHIHNFIQVFISSKHSHDLRERWRNLLQRVFSASSAEISGGIIRTPQIGENGMELLIPGIQGAYYIDVYGKHGSSLLFSQEDIQLSRTLAKLAIYTHNLQQAEELATTVERNRIMRDLHDDVGANLVSMIYRAHTEDEAKLARETLAMLRETIYMLDNQPSTRLPLAIAKWRQEIQQRCEAADIRLDWQTENILSQDTLDARQLVNLGRVLRETLTNALVHAHPACFGAHFGTQGEQLHVLIQHDGKIKPLAEWTEGKGIPSMSTRIQELGGEIGWTLTTQLETRITIPLHREPAHENIA